ncbi:tRNA pseudouridine(55) synthase TruB [Methylophaga sulfidovorans]|uniref:tRNA pseudouridine synthase B n=1 Tax=Methylophaga sulfidovorans TaxID=45496 RepID=A0A1I3UXW1_9GAMM|nr:tRNA pseudouridine(55) synthase TruB [Methylophaga sulfidovorans]SFJ86767.1 tRNA pseudouridine synthase B [Methylophaga sulfidovorans]
MARRNKKGRDITGIVIIDKPTGHSSNHILQRVKRLFDAKKAGHTGSLDPLATGVLPVCLGDATKLSSYLLDADKQYQVTCQLGVITDSGDSDGNVVDELPIPEFDVDTLNNIIQQFIGEIEQVPPMFSALKHQGQPLYKLARQGIDVERKARRIVIYAIEVMDCQSDNFTLSVRCSKGTYIRTLVEDISHALGSGGHVTMLRRTAVAGYDLSQAITVEALQAMAEKDGFVTLDASLQQAEEALPDWPAIVLDEENTKSIGFGQSVTVETPFKSANVRLFNMNNQFLGIGEMSTEGVVAPKRLFANAVS